MGIEAVPVLQATILVNGKAAKQKNRSHTSASIDFVYCTNP